MKKAAVILLLIFSEASLTAANEQKVIPLESDVYSFVWYQYKNEYYNNGYGKHNFDFDISNLTPDGFTTNMDQREPS